MSRDSFTTGYYTTAPLHRLSSNFQHTFSGLSQLSPTVQRRMVVSPCHILTKHNIHPPTPRHLGLAALSIRRKPRAAALLYMWPFSALDGLHVLRGFWDKSITRKLSKQHVHENLVHLFISMGYEVYILTGDRCTQMGMHGQG